MTYEKKKQLRREIRVHRQRYHDTIQQSEVNDHLLSLFLSLEIPLSQIIAGYIPLGTELNIIPLLESLVKKGYQICLPVVMGPSLPLIFRQWIPGTPLEGDSSGIPSPGADAPLLTPDVLLIPLLAFDDQGGRLGQGMGYYDITLATLSEQKSILAIGVAYEIQKISNVPTHPTDYSMDIIMTDQKIYLLANR